MPVITIAGLQLGALIAFAIVTETVFAWPGMGQLFIQSVQFADIPVMAAYLLLIGLLLRGDQPGRRPAVFRRRSAPARPAARRAVVDTEWRALTMSRLARARAADSDIWWSFKSSPLTVVAAVVDRC